MAFRYFDSNGATAGFGSVNGLTWNTSNALWSTSDTGVVATGVWPNALGDEAIFGTGVTQVSGGDITVSGTINLTKLTSRNIFNSMGLNGSGTLNFGNTAAVISVTNQANNNLAIRTISLIGSGGLTYQGTGAIFLEAPTTSGLTGTITIDGSSFFAMRPTSTNSAAPTVFFSASAPITWTNTATAPYYIQGWVANSYGTTASSFTSSAGGVGRIIFQPNVYNGGSFEITGSVTGLTGYAASALDRGIFIEQGASTSSTLIVKDLPRQVTFSSASTTNNIEFHVRGAAVASYPTTLHLNSAASAGSTTLDFFRSIGLQPFSITGGINRTTGNSGTIRLALAGSNTGANTIQGGGTFTAGLGNVQLEKYDAGKWVLDGSYPWSSVTLNDGTIQAANNSGALGTGNVTMQLASATLELSHSSGATWSNSITAIGTISNVAGNNTLSGAITLAGNTTITAAAGTKITISQAILGTSFTLTVAGAGTVEFLTDPTFTTGSLVSNSTGTVEVTTPASLNTLAAGTLNSGGTLEYVGSTPTTVTSTLNLPTGAGATFNLSAASTSPSTTVTYTNNGLPLGYGTSNFTLGLTGTNTGNNTLSARLVNGSTGTTGLSKTGIGTWVAEITSDKLPLNTGTTAITAGKLVISCESFTNPGIGRGTVTVGANAILQTLTGTNQKGRATYRGLSISGGTLGNLANIIIGG